MKKSKGKKETSRDKKRKQLFVLGNTKLGLTDENLPLEKLSKLAIAKSSYEKLGLANGKSPLLAWGDKKSGVMELAEMVKGAAEKFSFPMSKAGDHRKALMENQGADDKFPEFLPMGPREVRDAAALLEMSEIKEELKQSKEDQKEILEEQKKTAAILKGVKENTNPERQILWLVLVSSLSVIGAPLFEEYGIPFLKDHPLRPILWVLVLVFAGLEIRKRVKKKN